MDGINDPLSEIPDLNVKVTLKTDVFGSYLLTFLLLIALESDC